MEGFKLFVNGAYGKSNEESSFIYDPLYTMKTTITGQLSLSMLIERLTMHIPDIQWIQANTDGITARVPRKDADTYYKICAMWEKVTKLVLEHAQYKKMVVRDVSNYIAVYENGDTKLKGCFEIFQELHKNPSMRIVPIALKEYFVNGIPVEETIKNHTDIYDFCLMLKTTRGWTAKRQSIDSNGKHVEELGRITRYFISGKASSLYKEHDDGRINGVNVGQGIELFNRYYEKEMKDYNINYQFYISECYKIINIVEDRQLSLF